MWFFKEFFEYLKVRKKYWLLPIFLCLLIKDSDKSVIWTLPLEVLKFLEFNKFQNKRNSKCRN